MLTKTKWEWKCILIAVAGYRMANNCDEDIIVDLETTDIKTIIAVAIKENGRNIWKECLKIESHSCGINMQ
jgi:hypothetical protein